MTLLQSKKYVTAEKIAEKFNLSVRTVYRDIKALGESGIPISFEPQRGYFIVEGYFLPPVRFSKEEANAFLLMEAIVAGFSDKSIQKHYSSGLNKIKTVMRPSEKESIESLSRNIKLQAPACFIFDFEYLSVLQTAIAGKKMLLLEYKNNRQEVSKRTIEPIGLVFYALSWHLVAWCAMRQDYRDFKVARILRLTDTQQSFTQPQHISLNDYMKNIPVDY